jgi:hypothetical protein
MVVPYNILAQRAEVYGTVCVKVRANGWKYSAEVQADLVVGRVSKRFLARNWLARGSLARWRRGRTLKAKRQSNPLIT